MDFLRFLAEYRTPALESIFQLITGLAEETFVIAILCWLYWCRNKVLAYTLGFSYFLSGMLVQGLKLIFRVPRPWILDPEFEPVASAKKGAGGFSFPSGHTQSATALFSTLGFATKKRWAAILAFTCMLLVGFSRMYLGVHTPKDVLTSLVLTLLISYAVSRYLKKCFSDTAYTKPLFFFLVIMCTLLVSYTCYFYFTFPEHRSMAKNAFQTCGAGYGFAIGYYLERTWINFSHPETLKGKVLRFVVGMGSVVVLLLGLEMLLDRYLVGSVVSYLLLIVWIVAIYPYLFSKFNKNI